LSRLGAACELNPGSSEPQTLAASLRNMADAALLIFIYALVWGGATALYPHPIDWGRENQDP
jgi:hypothetical protein